MPTAVMSFKEVAAVFVENVETKKYSSMCVEARMTLGMLRSSLRHLRLNLTRLLPYLQIILQRVCAITYDDYLHGYTAWTYRWKELSHKGYDVHKNRWVGYGNAEYASLFGFLYFARIIFVEVFTPYHQALAVAVSKF